MSSRGANVQVILRCRPFSEDELQSNAPQVITCNECNQEVSVSQSDAGKHRVFDFDKVFGPSSEQKDFYDQTISPLMHEVLEGFNGTILAYGQTGTGQTYTTCTTLTSGRVRIWPARPSRTES